MRRCGGLGVCAAAACFPNSCGTRVGLTAAASVSAPFPLWSGCAQAVDTVSSGSLWRRCRCTDAQSHTVRLHTAGVNSSAAARPKCRFCRLFAACCPIPARRAHCRCGCVKTGMASSTAQPWRRFQELVVRGNKVLHTSALLVCVCVCVFERYIGCWGPIQEIRASSSHCPLLSRSAKHPPWPWIGTETSPCC